MTTVGDAFSGGGAAAAGPAAAEDGQPGTGTRRPRDARARLAPTERDGNPLTRFLRTAWEDWRGAWWWTASPAPLAEVIADRMPSADRVPDGSAPLRIGWTIWNHLVTIPATWALLPLGRAVRKVTPLRLVLYGLVWVLQHPARFGLAVLIGGPVAWMWIKY